MPERLESEVLHKVRYMNTVAFSDGNAAQVAFSK